MKETSLIKILGTLSIKELNKWQLFVQSPYFNKDEDIIKLNVYLKKQYPSFEEKKMERKIVHSKVFGKTTFDYLKLRRLFSNTLKLLEHFFLIEYQKENKAQGHLHLMKVLDKRGLDKRFQKIFPKAKAIIEKNKTMDRKYYYSKFLYLDYLESWQASHADLSQPELLQSKIDCLDRFYLMEKLNQTTLLINRKAVLEARKKSYDFKFPLIEEISKYIKENNHLFKDDVAILIYHKIYISLTNKEDEDNYYELCELVKMHANKFTTEEGRFLYFALLNYAADKINKGNTSYFQHTFDIQKEMLYSGYIMENEILSEAYFNNLVVSGLGLKEFDWVENFIEEYHKYLPKNIRSNAYNYNKAIYFCDINNYDKAHHYLNTVKYTELRYSLNAKSMLLRVYYETGAEELLDSHISAFKVYLMRNNMIGKSKYKRYYNFFRFTGRLYSIKQEADFTSKNENEIKINKLKKKIAESGRLPFRRWLITCITEVEEKYINTN